MAAVAINYVPVWQDRPDEANEIEPRPNKRRRISQDDDDLIIPAAKRPAFTTTGDNVFNMPPSPPSSPWPSALSPSSSAVSQQTQSLALTKANCSSCRLTLVNVFCSRCDRKFCGRCCFERHAHDVDDVLCDGTMNRIPFYDPVPNLDLHFGFAKPKEPLVVKMDDLPAASDGMSC